MTIKTAATSVTTSATKLTTFTDSTRRFEGGYQSSVAVYNNAAATIIEVGGPDVTYGTGVPILAGTSASFDLGPDDDLYAIAASGTVDTRVLASGV